MSAPLSWSDSIRLTQKQIKLAFVVRMHCAIAHDVNAFDYLDCFSYGKHIATQEELSLSPSEDKIAASVLEHSSIYVLAMQPDTAVETRFGKDRINHGDAQIRRYAARHALLV